jgi:hypothetical protein
MAECLGWPDVEIGYADIIALRENADGWSSYDCAKPEWGNIPLLAYTDPTNSSTGRSVLLSLYAIAANKAPEDLTVEDVNDEAVVEYVKSFQRLVDHYLIGTRVLNSKVHRGPRWGHFFLMPEDNLINLKDGSSTYYYRGVPRPAPAFDTPMVMIYPKEGSMPRNNCACIVEEPWVSDAQREGAEQWIDYLREDEQQRALMAYGFRPASDIDLTDPASKITAAYGLDPNMPLKIVNPALIDADVASSIDGSWGSVKRPGVVTFVVDSSTSMEGEGRLAAVHSGLNRAINIMADKNQVGLVSFSSEVERRVEVAPLETDQRFAIADSLDGMRAVGGTALYQAIRAGGEMSDSAPGDPDAIRSIIVITDGKATGGDTRLDDLVEMITTEEFPVTEWSGFDDSMPTVAGAIGALPAEVIGASLKLETEYPV